ncbi:MAG TPA: hypothetical protein DEQ43_13640, partial [Nocardioides bacterium]|nr:hypothetical protein [Nocardioides sp.]
MSKPTRFLAVEDLDATETLAAAEKIVHERRAVEVQEVEVALHWADLHGQLPAESEQRPRPGGPRLVQLGGVGTPKIVDLAIGEFAIARGQNVLATRLFLADVLDLRHRLPELYAAFGEGQMDLWVARKV